jgi:hypothetical protein
MIDAGVDKGGGGGGMDQYKQANCLDRCGRDEDDGKGNVE